MPTLTLDLPDAAYQAALAFDPAERVRLATVTFIAAEATLPDEKYNPQPELSEEDYAAIGEGLAQLERGEGTPGEIVFARLRAKHGFPKGEHPL